MRKNYLKCLSSFYKLLKKILCSIIILLIEVIILKGFKGFYKNNRVYVILMIISITCILAVLIGTAVYFIGQSTRDPYGTRLEGIDAVKLSDDRLTEMTALIKENTLVNSANINIKGKIIYIVVKLNDGVPNDAETIAVKTLEKLSDDEKNFYDIQYIFDSLSTKDDNVFPIMGYKKAGNATISWTKYSS